MRDGPSDILDNEFGSRRSRQRRRDRQRNRDKKKQTKQSEGKATTATESKQRNKYFDTEIMPKLRSAQWPCSENELQLDDVVKAYNKLIAYPLEISQKEGIITAKLTFPSNFDLSPITVSVKGQRQRDLSAVYGEIFKQLNSLPDASIIDFAPGGKYFNWDVYGSIVSRKTLTAQDNTSSKLHVLAVGLRHGALPKFVNSTYKGMYTVAINWPELDINIKATRSSQMRAELGVCLAFKILYEQRLKDRGELQQTMYINDMAEISPPTARKFMHYLAIQLRVNSSPVYNVKRKGQYYSCAILIEKEMVGEIKGMHSSENAKDGAALVSTFVIAKRNPELWTDFLAELRRGHGKVLNRVQQIFLRIDYPLLSAIRGTINDGKAYLSMLPVPEPKPTKPRSNDERWRPKRHLTTPEQIEAANASLTEQLKRYNMSSGTEAMRKIRADLPFNHHKDEIMALIDNNDVVMIVGATGSGKSTQVPQIILDSMTERGQGAGVGIICTQPRRIAAVSVAERVAAERGQKIGHQVGYTVRFESKIAKADSTVDYVTIGVLLRRMFNDIDRAFDGVTHLIIDEVHERSTLTDFLLVLLKRRLQQRETDPSVSVPKIILMSATVDTTLFVRYFQKWDPPTLSVPGRTFPVDEYYLDDIIHLISSKERAQLADDPMLRKYLAAEHELKPAVEVEAADDETKPMAMIDWRTKEYFGESGEYGGMPMDNSFVPIALISKVINHIITTSTEGSILVFLPGYSDILATQRELLHTHANLFDDRDKFRLYMLHSSLVNAQREVFEKVPAGCRKIILSTNIAETSVTIPELQYVIDCGKERELKYLHSMRVTTLMVDWISRSNVKQRAGRAGRVQNGVYYGLYAKRRLGHMNVSPTPEILRTDLQQICLESKSLIGADGSIEEFLNDAIEPPNRFAIAAAISELKHIGALASDNSLTAAGSLMSVLPVHPSHAWMILLSILFRCFDPAVLIAAIGSGRSLFLRVPGGDDKVDRIRKRFGDGKNSDVIADMNAFREYRRIRIQHGQSKADQFCNSNMLHRGAMQTVAGVAQQIEETLVKQGVIAATPAAERYEGEVGPPDLNSLAVNEAVVKALHFIGNYPNVAIQLSPWMLQTAHENNAIMHMMSLNMPEFDGPNRYKGTIRRDTVARFGTVFGFDEKIGSAGNTQVQLKGTTRTSPVPLLLFAENVKLETNADGNEDVVVDEWLPFCVNPPIAVQPLIELRETFKAVVARSIENMVLRTKAEDEATEARLQNLLSQVMRGVVHTIEIQDQWANQNRRTP
ncbi:P-loop containing nucleoside triphosphate hydrolase protein [Lipomyces arxii]|uniref:P-loop containing nucleoside triphosphate hydrolase protein n=1 Tax=Lipomyces arxii TaxID=56418 RepID=UPI0034CF6146